MRVPFHELIDRTPEILSNLSAFLQLDIGHTQFKAASNFVESELVHNGHVRLRNSVAERKLITSAC
jgi:hypothetical protein